MREPKSNHTSDNRESLIDVTRSHRLDGNEKFKKRSLTWEKADADHQMVLVQQAIHLVAVEEIVPPKK